jgi:non-canonical poly(A) RNA polymerase PAPD5/7
MSTNPFQDPSVLHASSPSAPPKLDISHAASTSMPPPPVISPSAAPPGAYQYGAATASPAAGNSPAHKHQHNLMDEIGDSIKATNSTTILRIMRTVNILLATATITVGILAWIMGYVTSFQKGIAGIYIIMFGTLLLAFELRTEKVDRLFRQNFGFMYGNQTRTIFLLFIAIWPLSMGNFWLTILDAVLLFVNAFFNYFVINQHPAFSHHTTSLYDAPQGQPGQQPVAPGQQQPTTVDTQV